MRRTSLCSRCNPILTVGEMGKADRVRDADEREPAQANDAQIRWASAGMRPYATRDAAVRNPGTLKWDCVDRCKKSDFVGRSSQSAPRCPKWFDVSGGHYAATIFS
jgi:hypothetical protein